MELQLLNFDVATRLSSIAKHYFNSHSFDDLKALLIDPNSSAPILEEFNLQLEQIKQEDTANQMAEWEDMRVYNIYALRFPINKDADLAEINIHYRVALDQARVLHHSVFAKELGLYLQSRPNRPIGEIKALNTILSLMNEYTAINNQIRLLEARLVNEETPCATKLLQLQEYKDQLAQLERDHLKKREEATRYNSNMKKLLWISWTVLVFSIPIYLRYLSMISLVTPLSISLLTVLPALIPIVAFIIVLTMGIIALVERINRRSIFEARVEDPDEIIANEIASKINTLKITIADEMDQYSKEPNNLEHAKEEAEQLLEKAKNTNLPWTSLISHFSWFSSSAGSTDAEENTDSYTFKP